MIPPYPRASMRVQLSAEMTFRDVAGLVPYIADLGVSHLYTSPILAAREGSTHGYDIVDHNRLNPELGTESDFLAMVETLHAHDLGLIIDFVPNHMGVGYSDNAWWLNVLEWGQYSPYASFFDIDWKSSEQSLRGKVLVPVLGDQYGTVLENGELRLMFDRTDGSFSVHFYEHRFPITPRSYHSLISDVITSSASEIPAELHEELHDLATAFRAVGPGKKSASGQALLIRKVDELRSAVARLVARQPVVGAAIDGMCDRMNGTVGDGRSFDRLHALLERQAYRLAYWRLASNEINYRRFFDINDLAAVRMELPDVFEITHQLILRYIQDGTIQGLRLDHVDGLLDPKAYLGRLQEAAAYRLLGQRRSAESATTAAINQPLYVVAEKILARHETLRPEWQVSGTTGYDHMARVAEVFFAPDGEDGITETYEQFVGEPRDFESAVLAAKYRTMRETLASELNVLANRLSRLAKRSRKTRDFSRLALRSALTDIVARFPVYRSYVDADGPGEADRRDIEWAVASARKATETVDTSAYDFIQQVLTTDILHTYPGEFRRREVVELAMKVQQFTAPVMAKSFEDTAFYRDARFIARNEVGAEPDSLFTTPQGFHYGCVQRLDTHPFAMLSTATHDHKRGEDVRARLNVLSEIPEQWQRWAERFADYTAGMVTEIKTGHYEGVAPDRNDQFFLLQTIIGAWPTDITGPEYAGIVAFRERIIAYAEKASREAKTHTSWTAVDEEYEQATHRYLEGVLNPRRSPTIVRFIHEIVTTIAPAGAVNALGQKLLTLTVPGVPDVYQGTERWDFSLVDPDNRRTVDFDLRRADKSGYGPDPGAVARVSRDWRDGAIKQYVVTQALQYRKRHPDLFAAGSYLPLEVTGTRGEHVIAFMREFDNTQIVVIASRLMHAALASDGDTAGEPGPLIAPREFWDDTAVVLPHSCSAAYAGILSGMSVACRSHSVSAGTPAGAPTGSSGAIPVGDALSVFPVALLVEAPE
ncbi:MAG: malto-oligosyltrehalose synthase [Spirochaeta sp.]|nr:malto-oligosyltrehalose synthase [Spirochaeta sp.]